MTEPDPFEPVYLFLTAMVGGAVVIAGIWFAFTVLAPILWP